VVLGYVVVVTIVVVVVLVLFVIVIGVAIVVDAVAEQDVGFVVVAIKDEFAVAIVVLVEVEEESFPSLMFLFHLLLLILLLLRQHLESLAMNVALAIIAIIVDVVRLVEKNFVVAIVLLLEAVVLLLFIFACCRPANETISTLFVPAPVGLCVNCIAAATASDKEDDVSIAIGNDDDAADDGDIISPDRFVRSVRRGFIVDKADPAES
jgi:hypothetical protein